MVIYSKIAFNSPISSSCSSAEAVIQIWTFSEPCLIFLFFSIQLQLSKARLPVYPTVIIMSETIIETITIEIDILVDREQDETPANKCNNNNLHRCYLSHTAVCGGKSASLSCMDHCHQVP